MQYPQKETWQERLHRIIYEADTPAGKAFDVLLLILILASIIVVMLDSVTSFHARYGHFFLAVEWVFTILFSIEYILRLISIRRPLSYVLSPLGIIDLLAISPTYLNFLIPGAHALLALRALRLLRIFRIFKLTRFLTEIDFLQGALKNSLRKIGIFMSTVLTLVLVLGSIMYLVEGGTNGFDSIPQSIYWAIVTITTVGYGDVSPATSLGKLISSAMMLIGYAIIAVPTGIITHEMVMRRKDRTYTRQSCPNCGREGHDADARYCKYCGSAL